MISCIKFQKTKSPPTSKFIPGILNRFFQDSNSLKDNEPYILYKEIKFNDPSKGKYNRCYLY